MRGRLEPKDTVERFWGLKFIGFPNYPTKPQNRTFSLSLTSLRRWLLLVVATTCSSC